MSPYYGREPFRRVSSMTSTRQRLHSKAMVDVAAEFERTELELLSKGLLPVDRKSWGSGEVGGRSLRGDGGLDSPPTKD